MKVVGTLYGVSIVLAIVGMIAYILTWSPFFAFFQIAACAGFSAGILVVVKSATSSASHNPNWVTWPQLVMLIGGFYGVQITAGLAVFTYLNNHIYEIYKILGGN